MDFEIEFFPVGDASKAGDAIVARYGQNGRYEVAVIDGGTEDSGNAIVNHVRSVYGPNTRVAHVVSTHPDTDHASGLRRVLDQLPVDHLWLHGLWYHAPEFMPLLARATSVESVQDTIRRAYPIVAELIAQAHEKRIPISEPFQGEQIGPFRVLSPSKWHYLHLVPQFRKTHNPNVEALERVGMWLGESQRPSALAALVEKVVGWISESWDLELLREGGVTAAENESSTILIGEFGAASVLLTADAGLNALQWACDYADSQVIDLRAVSMVQVPHHGSRRNVSPSALNRLLGPKVRSGSQEQRQAIVSAPKDDDKHPRKIVLNAFLRRGAGVRSTQGKPLRFHSGTMPARSDESPAVPYGFFDRVEAYD